MVDCIFCKIAAGMIPCHKLFETPEVLAFLDVAPLAPGHTLVIPKVHHATMLSMSPALVAACCEPMPALAREILAVTGATDWNLLQNNGKLAHQAVGHVHFHLIPRFPDGRGLGINWSPEKLDAAAGQALAESIRARLG